MKQRRFVFGTDFSVVQYSGAVRNSVAQFYKQVYPLP